MKVPPVCIDYYAMQTGNIKKSKAGKAWWQVDSDAEGFLTQTQPWDWDCGCAWAGREMGSCNRLTTDADSRRIRFAMGLAWVACV